MQTSGWGFILKQIPWMIVAAVVGAAAFVWVQQRWLGGNIADYIGGAIVDQGHYVQERPDKAAEEQARQKLSKIFGWGVHLGVSLSYAVLYGILTSIPGFPRRRAPRWIFALILAALLGWVTTLLTGPDIEITISVLAGQGWPQEVSGLNWGLGVPFWNHMLFFGICFVFIVLIPDLVRGQVQTSSMHA